MVCFIRDISTWAHIAQCDVTDYEVPLFSVENITGKIRVAEEHPEFSACWAILDGNIFYVESASPNDGYTELTVSRPMNAFDRTLVYEQNLVYEETSDTEFDPEKRYYVKTSYTKYFRTSDDERDSSKSYFLKTDVDLYAQETISSFQTGITYYNMTTPPSYIKTSDQSMIPTKVYYTKSGNNYIETDDKYFHTGVTYYEKTSEAVYSVTSDSSFNSNHTYYVNDYYGDYIKINSNIFEYNGIYYESSQAERYTTSEDEGFISGTVYYELVDTYGGIGTEVLETFIKKNIEKFFVNETDPMYSMPYIDVEVLGDVGTVATLNIFPNEVYSFLDVVDLAYEKKILFAFLMTASGITIYIFPTNPSSEHVVFGDGHNLLEDSTISSELIAKVTVRRVHEEEDYLEIDEEKDYYWHPEGYISSSPPNPRIKGIWDIVSIEDEDIDLIEAAEESMANNDEAIKVSFYSDQNFYLWDKISCLVKDKLITESISSCTISMGDPRFFYTIGKMPTTLTDKFEQSNGTSTSVIRTSGGGVSKSATYENSNESYLAKTGGSVNGNVGVKDTTSTDKLVVGSNSYGSTLPSSGKTGQVFFLI